MTEAVSDPRTLECDLIMKGGVTSGLVYPGAIARIARRYTIRSIGGTSAGAIAAAAAAAMELGIASGRVSLPCALALMRGLSTEAAMPTCRGNSLLEALFTADGVFQKPFDLIKQQLRSPGAGTGGLAFMAAVWRAAPAFLPAYLMVKAAAGLFAAVVIGLLLAGPLGAPAWLAFVLAGMLGFVGLAWALVSGLANGLSELASRWQGQGWGIATGMARPGPDACDRTLPALTEWLHQKFQTLAGLDDDEPITFGHLWKPGAPAEASSRSPHRQTSLVLVATDLNRMLSVQFPFLPQHQRLFFDPDEWAGLFPKSVMDWLATCSKQPSAMKDGEIATFEKTFRYSIDALRSAAEAAGGGKLFDRLRLMPKARQLPVIVAVRASMAFPGLFKPLPFWLLRWGRDKEGKPKALLSRVLLSDGGITSNFPIHLFDAPVPSRPTFAINLVYPDDEIGAEIGRGVQRWGSSGAAGTGEPDLVVQMSGGGRSAPDERRDVFMPFTNSDWVNLYKRPASGGALAQLGGLATRVVEVARTWGDVALYNQPGMRDRIAHVRLTDEEGGFNLGMDAATIARLAEKGAFAADVLTQRFDPAAPNDPLRGPGKRVELNWHNHRFVRLRAFLDAQERLAGQFASSLGGANGADPQAQPTLDTILNTPGNNVMQNGQTYFVGYKANIKVAQRYHLQALTRAIPALVTVMPAGNANQAVSASIGAPQPASVLRLRPA